jgi:hypothetical protein
MRFYHCFTLAGGSTRFRSGSWLLYLLAGCGGAQSSTTSRTAAEREAAATEAAGPSVGNAYVNEGGIGVLGTQPSGASSALGPPLMARQLPTGEQVKLDGRLTEWPALSPARVELRGKTPASMEVAVQYDNDNIYVAAVVGDAAVERTRELSLREDHVSFVLAFPNGRSFVAYHLAMFAGKSGVAAGAVKLVRGNAATAVAGSKLVEAETSGKTVFEAKIPWTTFAEAATWRLGLRANVSYHDASGTGAVVSTGNGDAEHVRELAQLFTEPEIAVADGLLTPQSLTQLAPSFDLFANVAGDATKERISVYGGYLTVCGPKYRGGHQYFYREYPGEIVGVETKSVAAADREDLLVRRRIDVAGTKRELIELLSFVSDDPATLFTHEVAVIGTNQRISNSLRVGRGTIDIGIEAAQGWDQASYREGPLTDLPNVLLPWGAIKSQHYVLQGDKFALKEEVAQTPAPAANAARAPTVVVPDTARVAVAAAKPLPPSTRDAGAALLTAYRRERSLDPSAPPRLDFSAQLSEDPRPERIVLFGRELLIFGPGFRGGQRYETLNLSQFSSDADLDSVSARDLTGDGHAELVVRGTLRTNSAAGVVMSQVTLVYEVPPTGARRVFAIETARQLGERRVQTQLDFTPSKSGSGTDIEVRRGSAKGFTQADYPWSNARQDASSPEPVLVPWAPIASVRYTWNGSTFVANRN